MSEPTLTLQYDDLANAVSRFLGYGDVASAVGATNLARVDAVVQSGYRVFLYPPLVGGKAHRWSFLRPTTTINVWPSLAGNLTVPPSYSSPSTTLTASSGLFYPSVVGQSIALTQGTTTTSYVITHYVSSTQVKVAGDLHLIYVAATTWAITATGDFRLPDDYGAIQGTLTHGSQVGYRALQIVGENQIRDLRQSGTSSGVPRCAAIIPVSNDGSAGQRFNLMVWPTPDAVYSLAYRYHALMNKLSTAAASYPLGGAKHAQTILESCLAQAELSMNDEQGVHSAAYAVLLASSIAMDQTDHSPETLGYNGDLSGSVSPGDRGRAGHITYNGTQIW